MTTAEATRATSEGMPGIAVAGVTALVSGVSVFVNSYGEHSFASPALYTTAKNIVAATVLVVVAVAGGRLRRRRVTCAGGRFVTASPSNGARRGVGHWLGLAYVGVIGGGLAFVLFFNGLAITSPASAAFCRDTLVLWVALLAVPILRERVQWWNVAAILLLVAGEIMFAGGVGGLALSRGQLDVLAATLLWAVEVVVAKRLLRTLSPATLSLIRMGVGGTALVTYLAVTGSLSTLFALGSHQWGWILLTGLLLGIYVATWMTALARARALDVTSVLVGSAVITWLLQLVAGTAAPATTAIGLVLICAGAGLVIWAGTVTRTRSSRRSTALR
ncbi:MAG: DMT family transporter [Acidimicrobiales bacterium]|jgi:drug/metabolite transporter (DMT)-like permease